MNTKVRGGGRIAVALFGLALAVSTYAQPPSFVVLGVGYDYSRTPSEQPRRTGNERWFGGSGGLHGSQVDVSVSVFFGLGFGLARI